MLKKLLKHEFKNTWMEITIVNGATLVISLFLALILRLHVDMFFISLSVMAIMLLYLAATGLLIFNIIRSFNQKMFTNEGYLTMTLPITIDQLLISKIIVNLVWVMTTALSIILSLFFVGLVIQPNLSDFFLFDISELIAENLLPTLLIIIQIVISTLLSIMVLVFILSILNSGKIKKVKLLIGAFLFYAITNVISSLTNILIIIPYSIYIGESGMTIDKSYTIFDMLWGSNSLYSNGIPIMNFNTILLNIVFIALFYFISRKLIRDHLELE